MWIIRSILLFALMIAAIGFVLLNSHLDQRVAVDLYWRKYENARLLATLFFAFISGCAFTIAFVAGGYFRKMAQLGAARKAIRGLDAEVATLRNRSLDEVGDVFQSVGSDIGTNVPAKVDI